MLFIWATLFQESGLSHALTAGETYRLPIDSLSSKLPYMLSGKLMATFNQLHCKGGYSDNSKLSQIQLFIVLLVVHIDL